MPKFRLSPAYHTETIVFGAQGPALSALRIGQWVTYMKEQGIRRVCCLLHQDQLRAYRVDLLAAYGEEFGPDNVCWAPVADYHLCDVGLLKERILPFLKESDHTGQPVVVHCQGGRGRAGQILAAWLISGRGFRLPTPLPQSRKWAVIPTRRPTGATPSPRICTPCWKPASPARLSSAVCRMNVRSALDSPWSSGPC